MGAHESLARRVIPTRPIALDEAALRLWYSHFGVSGLRAEIRRELTAAVRSRPTNVFERAALADWLGAATSWACDEWLAHAIAEGWSREGTS